MLAFLEKWLDCARDLGLGGRLVRGIDPGELAPRGLPGWGESLAWRRAREQREQAERAARTAAKVAAILNLKFSRRED